MNIVPLAEVDGFIRTALTEVRKGVATARNNNQANPLNGIMVDLPEKIDFEMMVVTAYQTLLKSSSTTETVANGDRMSVAAVDIAGSGLSETSGDLESDVETSSKRSGELETEASSNRESVQGSESDRSGEADGEVGSSSEAGTSGQSSLEASVNSGSSSQSDVESKRDSEGGGGPGMENESKRSSGGGGGVDTYRASGTGTVGGSESSNERKSGTGTKRSTRSERTNGTNRTAQSGQVWEQNTRFARTFDQSTGRWGTQAFSTPITPCRLKCS